jgi:hypothetical protein
MEEKKHNCYNCMFRGTVPGSAHSSCNALKHIGDKSTIAETAIVLGIASVKDEHGNNAVQMDPIGIRGGWAHWPLDFDPTWVNSCLFYINKEDMQKAQESNNTENTES